MKRTYPVDVLWCANARGRGGRGYKEPLGWKFPAAVEKRLVQDHAGLSVLHLFGGRSKFGTRIDIDPIVRPDVLADAWLPPFKQESFDIVVLDPPYIRLNSQEKNALFRAAAYVARQRVVWFHTIWASTPPRFLSRASLGCSRRRFCARPRVAVLPGSSPAGPNQTLPARSGREV